jgi:hypothetical protein
MMLTCEKCPSVYREDAIPEKCNVDVEVYQCLNCGRYMYMPLVKNVQPGTFEIVPCVCKGKKKYLRVEVCGGNLITPQELRERELRATG